MKRKTLSIKEMGNSIIHGSDVNFLRENANLNGETFSGKNSKMGSEASKEYARMMGIPVEVLDAVDSNHVYIHDFDEYAYGTTNCIFIPFAKLLREGFSY